MLHELLLTLSGHTGNLFFKTNNGEIQLVSDVPFIHPSEAEVLGRLCKLATYYTHFQSFIQTYSQRPSSTDGVTCGLYVRALCSGLESVLQPYRQSLVEVEKTILQQPHLTAAHVQHKLEEYQSLFPVLYGVLQQIEEHKAHGCMILEILHKSSACGLPMARNAILKLLKTCHAVLYKQLGAWLLHGLLLDKHSEFFIQQTPHKTALPSSDEEDSTGGSQVTNTTEESSETSITTFCVRAEMLPSYIPSRVADKILFVGEVIHMFERDTSHQSSTKHTGSILKDAEDDFSRLIHKLSQQEFSLMAFENVMDNIRSHVAKHLWELVVEKADLPGQLKIIKDFYLLGRGELFLAFIDHAQSLLNVPPSGTTQYDINMAFQQAARSVFYEEDDLTGRFTVTVDPKANNKFSSSGNGPSTETGWNCLGLSYKVQWPLHILFTPTVLDRYNSMFGFLLRIRRAQLELQHVWAHQMAGLHATSQSNHPSIWLLRNHMAFLVDNLQYYLQVDVIESQFSQLQEQIQTTQDFEAIAVAHDQHVTALLAQAFLLSKPIWHCLNEILDLCHSFCGLIMQAETQMSSQETQALETVTKNFQRQSNLLFKILSSVRSQQASSHLAQLLLRLDFNKYYSQAGGQFGSYFSNSQMSAPTPSSSRH